MCLATDISRGCDRSTFQVKQTTGFYPRVRVDRAGKGVVSHAGGSLLTAAIRTAGLDRMLSAALAPWRKPMAIHDPAKVVLDLAVTLGLGRGLSLCQPGDQFARIRVWI